MAEFLAERTVHSVCDNTDEQAAPPMLSGRMLVPADGCWYPPAVHVEDVLHVDFDVRGFRGDGLYLLEEVSGGRVAWRGCRRFQRRLDGSVQIDRTGEGDCHDVASLPMQAWRIVGRVEQVYKPAARGAR